MTEPKSPIQNLGDSYVHYSTIQTRFETIRLKTIVVNDRHRIPHTLIIYVPQQDGRVRVSRILFEFRIDHAYIRQGEVDDALRAWLQDRTRYSWTEDAHYNKLNHGRTDVAHERDVMTREESDLP